jgi:hypothetical protein
MPTKPDKQPKGYQRRKGCEQKTSTHSVNPDEVISEINHQSTALQKIVSRFLDPVADDNSAIRQKQKE